MKVGALVTARMSSTRLPRKALLEVKNRPLLGHLFDRLRVAQRVNTIILCTTRQEQDAPLEDLARREGVECFRGEVEDVIKRLHDTCEAFSLDYALNVTGDCPLAEPYYADKMVEAFEQTGADLIRGFTLPHGSYCWGLNPQALRTIMQIKDTARTEVYGRFFTDVDLFRTYDLPIENPRHRRPELRMTLDYEEDFRFFEAVFEHLYQPGKIFTLDEILDLLDRHPEIIKINEHCEKIYKKRWIAQSEISLKPRYEVRKAAVIGCGSIGQRHIRNLRTLGITEITALRTHQGHTQALDPELQVREVGQWDDLLAGKPDLAIISNPSSLHVEAARRLLPVVRGLFLEKPVAAVVDPSLAQLCREAARLRKTIFVGYSLRFHPVVQLVQKTLADGALGDPICLQCQVGQWLPSWHPYEDYRKAYYSRQDLGGGVTLTLSHEIDTALALLGPADSVYGVVTPTAELEIDVDGISDLTVQHATGAVSQIHLDYMQQVLSRSGTLVCTKGWIRYDIASPSVQVKKLGDDKPQELWDGRAFVWNDAYVTMMETFLRFTREGRVAHFLDLNQGVRVLNLASQALRSAQQHVRLPATEIE